MESRIYEVWVDNIKYADGMSLDTALTLMKALCEKWYNDTFDIILKQKQIV